MLRLLQYAKITSFFERLVRAQCLGLVTEPGPKNRADSIPASALETFLRMRSYQRRTFRAPSELIMN